ncbi:MAG: FMN-binding negative transcriptional regulator [Zavarzinella sp.]|nr:FMN-binding negative transcriptional regulator [Zavarzinella sp.]
MYVPAHFAVGDLPALHEFIDRHPFGILVSQHEGAPFATHLPFLLDRQSPPRGTLLGHVARQNPQWRQLAGQQVLCVFNGPHAFISPAWYESENVVPTWNFVAVHVYGRARVIEDSETLLGLVTRLTDRFERDMPAPWRVNPDDPFMRKLASRIVGFEVEIERIEGKWKLNQNHPADRRQRVIAALREQGYGDALEIADLMERGL